jgi:hypothetical protein
MNFFEVINKINWSALLATIALILSQLPPIKQLIKGKRLRMVIADIAQFSHVFGNTNLSLWIDLENVGAKMITVDRIKCYLTRRDGPTQILNARTYWMTESLTREKQLELPFALISLKPGDKWSGYVHLWDTKAWSKAVESKTKSLISKMRADITTKAMKRDKELTAIPMNERPVVEADLSLMNEINDLVKSLKRIEEGDYELLVGAYEESSPAPIKMLGFNLTIFETDAREIFEDMEDYKYGFGLHIPSTKTKWLQVTIRSKSEFTIPRD